MGWKVLHSMGGGRSRVPGHGPRVCRGGDGEVENRGRFAREEPAEEDADDLAAAGR